MKNRKCHIAFLLIVLMLLSSQVFSAGYWQRGEEHKDIWFVCDTPDQVMIFYPTTSNQGSSRGGDVSYQVLSKPDLIEGKSVNIGSCETGDCSMGRCSCGYDGLGMMSYWGKGYAVSWKGQPSIDENNICRNHFYLATLVSKEQIIFLTLPFPGDDNDCNIDYQSFNLNKTINIAPPIQLTGGNLQINGNGYTVSFRSQKENTLFEILTSSGSPNAYQCSLKIQRPGRGVEYTPIIVCDVNDEELKQCSKR